MTCSPSRRAAAQPAQGCSPAPERAALLQQAAEAAAGGPNGRCVRGCCVWPQRSTSPCRRISSWRSLQSRTKQPRAALAILVEGAALAPNAEEVLSAYAQLALTHQAADASRAGAQSLTRMCPSVAQYHYLLGVGLMAIGDMPTRSRRAERSRSTRAGPRADAPCARSRPQQPGAVRRGQAALVRSVEHSRRASKRSRRWRRPKRGSATSTPPRATRKLARTRAGERDGQPRHGPGADANGAAMPTHVTRCSRPLPAIRIHRSPSIN